MTLQTPKHGDFSFIGVLCSNYDIDVQFEHDRVNFDLK